MMTFGFSLPLPGGLEINDPLNKGGTGVRFYSIGNIISELLPYLFVIGGLILLVMLLVGGFEILVSVGNEEKMKGGAARIKNALLGFLLLFAVYWLAQIAQVIFKIPIL